MSGNVWQWVEDCFSASHAGASPDGAARVDGDCSYRVNRGASWVNSPRYLRAAARHKDEAQARTSVLGLRLARDLAPAAVAQRPPWVVSAVAKPAVTDLTQHCLVNMNGPAQGKSRATLMPSPTPR